MDKDYFQVDQDTNPRGSNSYNFRNSIKSRNIINCKRLYKLVKVLNDSFRRF